MNQRLFKERQAKYAIISGRYAVIRKGRRVVEQYKSGEKLRGRIAC